MALAGRAAEEQEYGEASSGISSDLAAATTIAAQLVGQLGNGPGLLSLEAASMPTAANLVAKVLSDEPSREAAEALMREGADRAAWMVSTYRPALYDIADGLCASDELDGDTVRSIVANRTPTSPSAAARSAASRPPPPEAVPRGQAPRTTRCGSDPFEGVVVEDRGDAVVDDVGA